MKKNVSSLFKLFGLFILVIGLILVFRSFSEVQDQKNVKQYKAIELVENETKVKVQPLVNATSNMFNFHVYIESYENKDSLTFDPMKNAILVDNEENPSLPVNWVLKNNSTYSREGVLTFPPFAQSPQTFTLIITSEEEDYTFTWSNN